MNDLAKFTMDAHGGLHRWRQLKTVPARLLNGGVFWGLKGKDGILNDVHVSADSRKEWAGRDRFAAEVGLSDTDYTTCLNVSSASLVFAGDAAYSDVHPYLIESNAQTRREWFAALDTIESLKPRAVIAGHEKPEKDDSPRIIEETRHYIRDFDRVAGTTTTARELYDKMLEFYPDRANPGSLWGSARATKR